MYVLFIQLVTSCCSMAWTFINRLLGLLLVPAALPDDIRDQAHFHNAAESEATKPQFLLNRILLLNRSLTAVPGAKRAGKCINKPSSVTALTQLQKQARHSPSLQLIRPRSLRNFWAGPGPLLFSIVIVRDQEHFSRGTNFPVGLFDRLLSHTYMYVPT